MRWRFGLGGTSLGLAALWKLVGSQGRVIASFGPFPDATSGDLRALPLTIAGLVLLAADRRLSWRRRIGGVGGVVLAVLWVASDLPWDDPLLPGLQGRRHGVHSLDLLAVGPFLAGLVLLVPVPLGWWGWALRHRRMGLIGAVGVLAGPRRVS